MATKEAPVHDVFKQKMVESPETSTMVVMESIRNASRVIRNPWAEKILEMEKDGASLEDLMPYIGGQISRKGWVEGNLDEGLYSMGQCVGRIKDIPSVSELVERIIGEAKAVKGNLDQVLS
jgi:nitronate monooxygenase